jgi:hypothetical protein
MMGIRWSISGAKVPPRADAAPPCSVLLSRLISLCAGLQIYRRHRPLCRSAASESADFAGSGMTSPATSACPESGRERRGLRNKGRRDELH